MSEYQEKHEVDIYMLYVMYDHTYTCININIVSLG